MSRAQRLLELLELLRQHKRPVTGASLAESLNISLRTLYRDIDVLRSQGAVIEAEAGLGYVLRPGYLLPPLMFTASEIEALVLGARWISTHGDHDLAAAAQRVVTKISAVLPDDLRTLPDSTNLFVGPASREDFAAINLAEVRRVIREERKVEISYADGQGETSNRVIWPFALAFFNSARVIAAWCELRQSFRAFRTDRVLEWRALTTRYPRRRQALLKAWRAIEKIPEQ